MKLYYASGPACSCMDIDDDCAGCTHARFTAFLRGWSWVAVALERRLARRHGRAA